MSNEEIEEICDYFGIENYTINDGMVDVDDHVRLDSLGLTDIPLNFNIVSGHFFCTANELTSLKGAPKEVGGVFHCDENKLTSLEGCPDIIGSDLYAQNNKLTTLEGCPDKVGRNFNISFNPIINVDYLPTEIGGKFYCHKTPLATMLNEVELDLVYAFKTYKVIKGRDINLKRLRYVMNLFNQPADLKQIKRYYNVV